MARALNNPLAVSLGDPAGIGPEVIAKCWDHRDSFNLPPFVAIEMPARVARRGDLWKPLLARRSRFDLRQYL
jgi:4-hydroxy-L-threonine phosphate dehydrogenase PdxA